MTKPRKERFELKLDAAEYAALETLAKKHGLTKADVVRQWLRSLIAQAVLR